MVLDGDREELKSIKKQLDLLREMRGPNQMVLTPELRRLQQERQELLDSGIYRDDSFVIKELDRRIRQAKSTRTSLSPMKASP